LLLVKLNFNIWRIIGLLAIILFAVLFFKIVIYLTVSLVLFLLGYPITYRLEKIKIGSRKLPDSFAALITIALIIAFLLGLFFLILPPLANEINFLYDLNLYEVLHNILDQFPSAKALLLKFGSEEDLRSSITTQLNSFVNASTVSLVLNNIFGYFSSIAAGVLCVLFITFFLLKDENIVKESLLVITPLGLEDAVSEILRTSKKMLSKYFAGLFLDMFIVGGAVMILLSVLGIKNALVIAFCAALLNVIPYIGSIITMTVAILLGVSSCISTGSYELIGLTIYKIFFGLLSINLIDGFIIQPLIFSNSVKAHPLEIFIVTLMAATLGGIFGMVVALPTYTLIRIVAKEFLTHLKFFNKISEKITF
jgi:predicted PurR-regulated permease PerM